MRPRARTVPSVVLLGVLAVVLLGLSACGGNGGSTSGLAPDVALKIEDWSLSNNDFLDELHQVAKNQRYIDARTATNGGKPFEIFTSGTETPDPDVAAEFLNERVSFQLAKAELAKRNATVTDADRQQAIGLLGASLERTQDRTAGTTVPSPPTTTGEGQPPSTTSPLAASDTARQLGQQVLDGFTGSYRQVLLDGLSSLVALQRVLMGGGDTEAQVRDLYEHTKEESCVSHILVKPNPNAGAPDPKTGQPIIASDAEYQQALVKATELRAQLIAGADFATLARQSSDDATTKDKGGDLGCHPRLAYVQSFDDAIWQLAPNSLSQPVKTEYGYHLILVRDRRTRSFEETRAALEQAIAKAQGDRLQEWLSEATRSAKVEVAPVYGTWDPFNGTIRSVGGRSTNLTLAPLEDTTTSGAPGTTG